MQEHFEKLKVWQSGMKLVRKIYQLTKNLPKEEMYGLTGQMRRAAVSIPSNIAEGKGRSHAKEFLQFLHIARGSAFELQTLIQVAQDLDYLKIQETQELFNLLNEINAMLIGLIRSLK